MILGLVHILLPFCLIFYTFFAKSTYDKLIYLLLLLIAAHWILFNGECIFSYGYKKWKNPSYVMGSDIDELHDVNDTYRVIKQNTGVDLSWISNYRLFLISYLLFCVRVIMLQSVTPAYSGYALFLFIISSWHISFYINKLTNNEKISLKGVTLISASIIFYITFCYTRSARIFTTIV